MVNAFTFRGRTLVGPCGEPAWPRFLDGRLWAGKNGCDIDLADRWNDLPNRREEVGVISVSNVKLVRIDGYMPMSLVLQVRIKLSDRLFRVCSFGLPPSV